MYKNILVPVSLDDDRDVNSALKIAEILATEMGSITVLHVVEHIPQHSENLLPEDHFENSKSTILGKLQPLIVGIDRASLNVVEGHSGRTILDYAASHNIDCIVIASHRPGLTDYFLGSTASRVVRHASCAVHVIR